MKCENYDFSSLVYVYTAGEAACRVARKWTQKFKCLYTTGWVVQKLWGFP